MSASETLPLAASDAFFLLHQAVGAAGESHVELTLLAADAAGSHRTVSSGGAGALVAQKEKDSSRPGVRKGQGAEEIRKQKLESRYNGKAETRRRTGGVAGFSAF